MGKDSKIAWTDHTFNPWWGCSKVSPGCANCYAATFSKRMGLDLWGASTPRRFFGAKHWVEPYAWNRAAERAGKRARVFCASMADVFEDRRDVHDARAALTNMIDFTPWLDWLLLTKRPENIDRLEWPSNVWIGVTAENQTLADSRWHMLSRIAAPVRFLSVEPMLGYVSIHDWAVLPEWVIIGGESGTGARPFYLDAATRLVAECQERGVPVFVKQMGRQPINGHGEVRAQTDREGRNPAEWPEYLRVQEWPR
jgi:protein gp37